MARLGENRNGWAWLLIAGGLALLATQLGWVGRLNDWLWALLFLGGGAAFFYHFSTSRRDWWALIPAAALAAIGVSILGGAAGGAYFLGVLGIGFALVYLTGHERWWAIIPAGVLITLAVVAWTDARFPRLDTGWLFFLGLAATFGLLYLLPASQGGQRWAVFPALAALALVLVTVLSGAVSGVVFPLALIFAGAYLLWRRGSTPRSPTVPQGGA